MAPPDEHGGPAGGPAKPAAMKSAYELALERIERQGIERPRGEAISEETRRRLSEVRQQAEAKLAELQILHHDRLKTVYDATQRREAEADYVRERRRIEDERDRKLAKLRGPRDEGQEGAQP